MLSKLLGRWEAGQTYVPYEHYYTPANPHAPVPLRPLTCRLDFLPHHMKS